MSRIHDAEHSQLVEHMRRRVAELEIEVYRHLDHPALYMLDSSRPPS